MIDDELDKQIVNAMQLGLKRAKIAKLENGDEIDNSEAFKKVDKIINALKQIFDEKELYDTYSLFRGSYEILLVHNRSEHKLFSFMSNNRLKELRSSNKAKDKRNYIFGLMQFNQVENSDRCQQVISPEFNFIEEENQMINNKVRAILNDDENLEYFTITYDVKAYSLFSVIAYKLSKYAEEIDRKDLSENINMVDYEDIYIKSNNPKTNEEKYDLDFEMKEEFLINNENQDIDIDLDLDEKEGNLNGK